MFKKFLCLMLAVMTLIASAGCGRRQAVTTNGAQDDESKPYNIVWYYIAGTETADNKLIEEEVNKITKKEINATVEMSAIDWGSYEGKMNPILASGESFDLCMAASWILLLNQNIQRNAFADIKDEVDAYGQDIKAVLGEDVYNMCLKDINKDGEKELYYASTRKDYPVAWGFVYRKDLVEKYNIDIENINSYEELMPALDIIKKNEPDVIPTLLGGGSGSPFSLINFSEFLFPYGMFYEKNIGTSYNLLETEEYVNAAKMSRKLYTEGYVRKDGNLLDSTQVEDMKKNGEFFCWVEQLKPGKADEISEGKKHLYTQHIVTTPIMSSAGPQGSVLAVSRTSKNPARVVKFINLLYKNKDLLNLINFGIEGKHYKKVGENRIEKIENSGYNRAGMQWMFGDTTLNYLLPTEADEKYENIKEFNASAVVTPYSDCEHPLDLGNASQELKTEIAACNTIKNEYTSRLIYGITDYEATIKEFKEKLDMAGADRIKEYIEKAAADYRKANGLE